MLILSRERRRCLIRKPGWFVFTLLTALVIGLLVDRPVSTSQAAVLESARYQIDASQSHFMVKAFAGGLLSAFAHDHNIAIREFGGEAQFTYGSVDPASLQMTVKA